MASSTAPVVDLATGITPLISPKQARFRGTPSIQTLRDALQTADGTTYTNAVLDSMTKLDLIYAANQLGV